MVLTKRVKIEAVGFRGAVARRCVIWAFRCHALPVIYRQQAKPGRRTGAAKRGRPFSWWFWATAVPVGLRGAGQGSSPLSLCSPNEQRESLFPRASPDAISINSAGTSVGRGEIRLRRGSLLRFGFREWDSAFLWASWWSSTCSRRLCLAAQIG